MINTFWIIASSVAYCHTMRLCSGYHFIRSAILYPYASGTLGFAVILCIATNYTSQNMILSYRILGLIFYSSGNREEILGMHWEAKCTVMLNIPQIWTELKRPSYHQLSNPLSLAERFSVYLIFITFVCIIS